MKRRNMGIVLIVLGIAILGIGIGMTISKSQTTSSSPYSDMSTSSSPKTGEHEQETSPLSSPEITQDDSTPTAKEKGNAFEDYVVSLLADWRFKLIDRTQDAVSSSGVVAESSKNPDLHVGQKRGKGEIDYYIECKYRSDWHNGEILLKEWQLNRYRQFQREKHRKVLIALGVGGTSSSPSTLMIIPIDSIKDNSIKKVMTKFVVQPTSSDLVKYMDSYFTTVFDKVRSRKNDSGEK